MGAEVWAVWDWGGWMDGWRLQWEGRWSERRCGKWKAYSSVHYCIYSKSFLSWTTFGEGIFFRLKRNCLFFSVVFLLFFVFHFFSFLCGEKEVNHLHSVKELELNPPPTLWAPIPISNSTRAACNRQFSVQVFHGLSVQQKSHYTSITPRNILCVRVELCWATFLWIAMSSYSSSRWSLSSLVTTLTF